MLTPHYNHPARTEELRILAFLHRRMSLPPNSVKRSQHLQKGYEGEVRFAKKLNENLASDAIVLYDLLLDSKGNEFQLDCVIIQERDIWHLEVKNYEGDYQMQDNDNAIYSMRSGHKLLNPLNQLDRSNVLLQETLRQWGYKLAVRSYVVFVHPEFTLYRHDPNHPIVISSQILRFIDTLNKKSSQLKSRHYQLARKLLEEQVPETYADKLPSYELEHLKGGIRCQACDGFLDVIKGNSFCCKECGYTEGLHSAVMRSVVEFNMLFPDVKITTKAMWNWCAIDRSKGTMKNILHTYMRPVGVKRHRHFVFFD